MSATKARLTPAQRTLLDRLPSREGAIFAGRRVQRHGTYLRSVMTGHPNGVKTAAMSYYGSTQTLRTLARKGYLRIVWDDPTEPIFMRENV